MGFPAGTIQSLQGKKGKAKEDLLLMEETLHQFFASLSFIPLFSGF